MKPEDFAKAKDVFLRALEVPEANRLEFIERETVDNPELRAEVISLLASREGAGNFLNEPLLSWSQGVLSEEPITTGATFDGIEVGQLLGQGGMGRVYAARDTTLNRDVALKTLSGLGTIPREVALQILKEAQRVSALRHPNIVDVHSFGWHKGVPYFLMELISGHDLAREIKLQSGTDVAEDSACILPQHPNADYIRRAVEIVSKIARAVQVGHEKRIIHRDIKPHNILLDQSGVPHLVDFGIAKDLSTDTITKTLDRIRGTAAYMSPEQTYAQDLDHRTDVWSLGVVLYELLTLTRPFDGQTAEATISNVREAPLPSVRRFTASVPVNLEWIVRRALQKVPADRYQSAAEFADDMDRWLRGEPTIAVGEPWWQKARRVVQKHRAGVLSAVLVAGFAIFLLSQESTAETRSRTLLKIELSESIPAGQSATVRWYRMEWPSGEPGPELGSDSLPAEIDDLLPGRYRILIDFGGNRWVHRSVTLAEGPGSTVEVDLPRVVEEDPPEMVRIPGGTLTTKLLEDSPTPFSVNVKTFLMDRTEVSNGDYQRYIEAMGGKPKPPRHWNWAPESARGPNWDRLPVVRLSIEEMEAYAAWAGKRIPTRSEWILAAQGPELSAWPWRTAQTPVEVGANALRINPKNGATRAERFEEYILGARPVDSAPLGRTPEGLYHMYGNVRELTDSLSFGSMIGDRQDSTEMQSVYGSSWLDNPIPFPSISQVASGDDNVMPDLGFRCARSIQP